MKRLILFLAFTSFALSTFSQINFGGKRNAEFGDSNLYGVGTTPTGGGPQRWSSLINTELNGLDYNYGVSGQSLTASGNAFDKTVIPVFDSNYVFAWFALGTNDLPLSVSVADFKAKLLEVVDYANATKGWEYSKMVLLTINVRLDVDYTARQLLMNEAIRQVAALRHTVFIDIYTPFKALPNQSTYFISDMLHINNAGHRAFANIVEASAFTPYYDPVLNSLPKGRNFKLN